MSATKRSILITGCSKHGSGHALATEFAQRGYRVFATARSTASLQDLAQYGVELLTLEVTDAKSIAALKEEISKRTGGKLDMLINNAGTIYEAPAIEASEDRVRRMFDTNVFGLMNMVTAFIPLLLAAVKGSSLPPTIVNVSSVLGRTPFPFSSGYNATKAAVTAYSDTLRLEIDPLGVKVVTLFMGQVSTALMSPDNISFGPESIYLDLEAKTKNRSVEHNAKGTKPDVFARQVVDDILSKSALNKGEYIWRGANAVLIWALNAFGPRKVFDGAMKSPVGLDVTQLRKSAFEKAQNKVNQQKL
ncbi:oxidoreductase [Leptodontidium sp. 2 PMI_412]|nr:oxidoreductase [Leptodontidium sp. 2 PMI_412]